MAKPSQKTFVTNDQGGPVECLGMTFPNDQDRREYYLEALTKLVGLAWSLRCL